MQLEQGSVGTGNWKDKLEDPEHIASLVAGFQIGQYNENTNNIYRNGANASGHPCSWLHGTFYLGLAECAVAFGEKRYWDLLVEVGERNGWRLGPRLFHADDQVIGQAYLEVYDHLEVPESADKIRERLRAILSDPPDSGMNTDPVLDPPEELEGFVFDDSGSCKNRWTWSDSLHMAPALWFHLARIDDDPRYAEFADTEFWETCTCLFDQQWSLFHRDSRFITRQSSPSGVSFWARGNGWVMLGLRRIVDKLPADHQHRHRYIELFQQMANRIVTLQTERGFWRSRLAPSGSADAGDSRETSGTAMFIAGFAWGLRNGYLSKKAFVPAVERGWQALQSAIHPDGRVGWVQSIDDRPSAAGFQQTHIYGTGAVLHACAELKYLVESQ